MKNFAQLKDTIYSGALSTLQTDRKKSKMIVRGYINILKNNQTLSEAFYIHNNLEQGCFENDDVKHGFIAENLSAIKNLNKDELRAGLTELDNFIKGNGLQYSEDLSVLSEKISSLMLNIHRMDKSIENNKSVEYIIESVSKRTPTDVSRKPVSHRLLKSTSSQKYNEKFGHLTELEKKIVKGFFSGDAKLIKEQYDTIVLDIATVVDGQIKSTEDKDLKIKLYEVKDKLYTKPENITVEHFKKLLSLQENLTK